MNRARSRPGLILRGIGNGSGNQPSIPEQYFTDDALSNPYFTNDAITDRYYTSDTLPRLLFGSPNNRPYQSNQSLGATDSFLFYYPHAVAHKTKRFTIGQMGWRFNNGAFALSNNYQYQGISALANGVAIPVTWDGGSDTKDIEAGTANNYLADFLDASDFGLDEFQIGDLIWFKGIVHLASTGLVMPHNTMMFTADVATSQYRFYNRSSTTPSAINALGPFTWTGTNPTTPFGVHLPFFLSYTDEPTVESAFAIGDSVLTGINDQSTANGACGRGPFQNALSNGTGTPQRGGCNFAISGNTDSNYRGANNVWKYWAQFTTIGVEELAINMINSGNSVATIQTNLQTIWSDMRDAGIQKIIRTGVTPVTTSSDSWATLANQTVGADYTDAGKAGQLNTWFNSIQGTLIDKYVPIVSLADSVETRKFRVNGVANYTTTDGTHLTNVGSDFMADDIRPALASI